MVDRLTELPTRATAAVFRATNGAVTHGVKQAENQVLTEPAAAEQVRRVEEVCRQRLAAVEKEAPSEAA
jgi:hypothetical protein